MEKFTKKDMKLAIESHLTSICINKIELLGLSDWIDRTGYDVDYFLNFEKYDNGISNLAEALADAFNDLIKFHDGYIESDE